MRAVWSHWTAPERLACSSYPWGHPAAGNAARCLSLVTVSRLFPDTLLITDSEGADLHERLGLKFGEVRTSLDAIPDEYARWWSLGKMIATRDACADGRPFFHIDGDAFLFKPPPAQWIDAPVFCEAPYPTNFSWLRLADFLAAADRAAVALPSEWDRKLPTGYALGVYGGSDLETLDACARVGCELVTDPKYAALWHELGAAHTQIAEEGTWAAVCSGRGVKPAVLFSSEHEKFRPGAGEAIGYAHALGMSKPKLAGRIMGRLQREAPDLWARCLAVAGFENERAEARA